jgi:hypothetical protein
MEHIRLEITKMIRKRISFIYLLVTIVILPLLIRTITYVDYTAGNIPEDEFAARLAYASISFSQSFFALPVWIIVFVGTEFSNGHVNRIVFIKSRRFYLIAKIAYCLLVALFFSIVAIGAFLFTIKTASINLADVDTSYCFEFFAQMFISAFSYSILLLAMVFIFRSPIMTYVIAVGLTTIEAIVYTLFEGLYNVHLKWLPFHLTQSLYCINGNKNSSNYYNPFSEGLDNTLPPIVFSILVILFLFYYFSKTDLKPLSD